MAQIKIRGITNIYTIRENEALEIKDVWENDQCRPDHKISIGPISFKKGDIQLIQLEENNVFQKGIDLSDPLQRENVRQFEKEFNDFCASQLEPQRTFEHFLQDKKIISFRRPARIAQSGMERFDLGLMMIHNTILFEEYNQKHAAINFMREYAEKRLPKDLENQKDTMFESEEINVKDIPF